METPNAVNSCHLQEQGVKGNFITFAVTVYDPGRIHDVMKKHGRGCAYVSTLKGREFWIRVFHSRDGKEWETVENCGFKE